MKSISKIRFLLAAFCAAFAAQAQTVNVVNAVTNGATSVSGEYTLTGVGGVTCELASPDTRLFECSLSSDSQTQN